MSHSWQVLNATQAAYSSNNGSSGNSTSTPAPGGGPGPLSYSCAKPCDDSGVPSAGCCASLWLPTLEMPNFLDQLSDQIPRYRITVSRAGVVRWSVRVVGRWCVARTNACMSVRLQRAVQRCMAATEGHGHGQHTHARLCAQERCISAAMCITRIMNLFNLFTVFDLLYRMITARLLQVLAV